MASASFTVSESDIRQWEAEATVFERRAAELRAKANAGRHLLGLMEAGAAEPGRPASDNLMGTITELANNAPEPLTKAELRAQLIARDFPKVRVTSNYFYLALKKLEGKNKISVLPDGRIWRRK